MPRYLYPPFSLNWVDYNSRHSELRSTPAYRDRPSETEGTTRRNRPHERRASIKLLCDGVRHNVHTYRRKMLNVGASSPLNLHRKALQAKLNPSASNSSRSVIGHPSFYSNNNKSVTSDATNFEGDNSHHPHSIPKNSSLVSFQSEDSPSRDGHYDHDRDPQPVLNIRLASGGIYSSDRSHGRGRLGHQTYVRVVSNSKGGNPRSSTPSHKVCNRTFQLGDHLSQRYSRHPFQSLAHLRCRGYNMRLL